MGLNFPVMCCSWVLPAGRQICGGEEEAAAGLPSHGDEQAGPDSAGVHRWALQRDPAVSAAFLSVSAAALFDIRCRQLDFGVNLLVKLLKFTHFTAAV